MVRTTTKPGQYTPQEKQQITSAVNNPAATMRQLVKNTLYYFIQYFWEQYSSSREFVPNWHIEKICDELEYVARRVADGKEKEHDLIVNVPPGSTKTATISVFFPVWCWVNWYWMRFMTASHNHDLSLESAEYSRDLIRSEKFRLLFPEIDIKVDKDNKSNFRVVKKEQVRPGQMPRTKVGGNRLSTSVKGGPTGYHADVLIWDDLIDPRKAISEAEVKTANNFLDNTYSQRKTDRLKSVTIGIMQRLHQNDPTAHLLEHRKNIRHICLPGEIRTPEYKKRLKPAEWEKFYIDGLMDPKRLGWKALNDALVELGQYGYAGQIGQDPTPPGGGMFKVDHLLLLEPHLLHPEANVVRTVRYWDKAGSEGEGAYTVGLKMAKLKNGKYVVMDVIRGQWSSERREKIIRQAAEADGRHVEVGVEQEPGSGGKDSAEGTLRNLAGFTCFKEIPQGDKPWRADSYSVQVNAGNVIMLRADWNTTYKDELRYFPFSTYKDQVDASAGAFKRLTSGKQVGTW